MLFLTKSSILNAIKDNDWRKQRKITVRWYFDIVESCSGRWFNGGNDSNLCKLECNEVNLI